MKTQSKPVAVINIAAYNEAQAVSPMMDTLFNEIFPQIPSWDCKVVVIDDTSPDGTYKVVEANQKKYKDLYLINNPVKLGMGNAVTKGFRFSMDTLHADAVIDMDMDFQHPPEDIIKLLKEIENGYDFVLGSRKIKGGSVPEVWGFKRKFFTYVGGFVARTILFFPFRPFFQVTDPTTGLRAYRVRGFIDKIDLDHLYTLKFGYKITLLFRMMQMKAKYKEIPLRFGLRETGESKIAKDTARDIFTVALKCRWYDDFTQKFLKFGIIGGAGFVVNVVGARIFKNIFITPTSNISLLNGLCNAAASELAIISNFTFNNLWTFAAEKITSPAEVFSKFITFNLSSVVTGIIIPSVVIALLTALFGDHLFLYQIIAIFGLTIPLNWIIYNTVIWKKK